MGPDFYDIRIYDSIHGYKNLYPYTVKYEFGKCLSLLIKAIDISSNIEDVLKYVTIILKVDKINAFDLIETKHSSIEN